MGNRDNDGGAKRQKLWRTGAMKQARELKMRVTSVVSIIAYYSGSVLIQPADRPVGSTEWRRPREWSEYIENQPERLMRQADELEMISRDAMRLSRLFHNQAIAARAEVKRREQS